jgi:hypothetical protein
MKKRNSLERVTLNSLMDNHPPLLTFNKLKERKIRSAFGNWIITKEFNHWHYSLYQFIVMQQLTYHDDNTINEAIKLFTKFPDSFKTTIIENQDRITRAIFSILRPNLFSNNDEEILLESPYDLNRFESIWLPEYIRYSEQIYNHLIQIPLTILDLSNGKNNHKDSSLHNRSENLRKLGYQTFCKGFNSTIRNSISHGNIEYTFMEAIFKDNNRQEVLSGPDFAEYYDNLVDTCNSLIIAILLFLSENSTVFSNQEYSQLPLGLLFLLIDGNTYNNGSHIISAFDSKIPGNNSQLNIDCYIDSLNKATQQFEALFFCYVASKFCNGKYERFVISIDCNMPNNALIIINGSELHKSIQNNLLLADCGPNLIESKLLWFSENAHRNRLRIFKNFVKPFFELFKIEMADLVNKNGIGFIPSVYKIMQIKNTSPRLIRRLEAFAVLNYSKKDITSDDLIMIVSNAIYRLRRKCIRKKDITGEIGFPYFPYFITLRLYSNQMRLRKLKQLNFQNIELVLIAEWCQNWSKVPPFYTKEVDFFHNGIRIRLNKELVKTM